MRVWYFDLLVSLPATGHAASPVNKNLLVSSQQIITQYFIKLLTTR